MKFLHNFLEYIFDDGDSISICMEWLDDQSSHNEWLIVRFITGLIFICLLIPIVIGWLILLNLEFFLSKLIFRQYVKIPNRYDEVIINETLKQWLEESLPYYLWTYVEIDYDLPILFRDRLYDGRTTEIRFLTKEAKVLFDLTWRGDFTYY